MYRVITTASGTRVASFACDAHPVCGVYLDAPLTSSIRPGIGHVRLSSQSVQNTVRKETERAQQRAQALAQRSKAVIRLPRLEKRIRLGDRVTFTLGCANLALTPYVFGALPGLFHLLHTAKVSFMVVTRFFVFRARKEHYYLFDFCYFANALLLYFIWREPTNATLFRAVFALSNGPLAWSILAFECSLVLHSLQHMTSVHIHHSPMLCTYIIRWHTPARFDGAVQPLPEGAVAGLAALLTEAMAFYLAWVLFYYTYIFMVASKRIKSRGYDTLFRFVMDKTPAGALLRVFPEALQPMAYMGMHLIFGMTGAAMTWLLYRSQVGHFAFIATMSMAAAWNASSYYFDYFASRYEEKLAKRVERHVERREKRAASSRRVPSAAVGAQADDGDSDGRHSDE